MRKISCTEDRICYMSPPEVKNVEMSGDMPEDLVPLSSVRPNKSLGTKQRRKKRTKKLLIGGRKLKRINRRPGPKVVRRSRKRAAPKRKPKGKKLKNIRRRKR